MISLPPSGMLRPVFIPENDPQVKPAAGHEADLSLAAFAPADGLHFGKIISALEEHSIYTFNAPFNVSEVQGNDQLLADRFRTAAQRETSSVLRVAYIKSPAELIARFSEKFENNQDVCGALPESFRTALRGWLTEHCQPALEAIAPLKPKSFDLELRRIFAAEKTDTKISAPEWHLDGAASKSGAPNMFVFITTLLARVNDQLIASGSAGLHQELGTVYLPGSAVPPRPFNAAYFGRLGSADLIADQLPFPDKIPWDAEDQLTLLGNLVCQKNFFDNQAPQLLPGNVGLFVNGAELGLLHRSPVKSNAALPVERLVILARARLPEGGLGSLHFAGRAEH